MCKTMRLLAAICSRWQKSTWQRGSSGLPYR